MQKVLTTLFLVTLLELGYSQTATEPKTYQNYPTGMQMFQAGYILRTTNSTLDGDLAFNDNEIDIKANIGYLRYARFFNLGGKTAGVQVMLPYVGIDADILGKQMTQSGFGDFMFILGSNIIGGDALDVKQFSSTPKKTAFAWSLATTLPTGSYKDDRLLNPGGNRWQFKPELGLTIPYGKWDFELYINGKFFTKNQSFVANADEVATQITQRPFLGSTIHLVYSFNEKFWISADAAGRTGGQTKKNNILQDDSQSILGLGGTLNFSPGRQHQIGINFISNAVGNDNAPNGQVACLKYSYILNPKH